MGSSLAAGDPHETDLYPDAAVTVGNWDGSEESRDDLVEANTERFGEPTDTPPDLGDDALLWNPSGEQMTLIVFDTDRNRDIVVSLYEAAP